MDTLKIAQAYIRTGLLILVFGVLLGGCATLDSDSPGTGVEAMSSEETANPDPFESFNRSIYKFNVEFDNAIGKPVARVYVKYMPAPVRTSVTNFFNNLWEPSSIINAILQGKAQKAVDSSGRFVINSTLGVLGLFDVATAIGIPVHQEDLGQTLAVWGVGDGPYLMLPFLGPTNVRDTTGLVTEFYTTDMLPVLFRGSEGWALWGLRLIDSRASVLGLEEVLEFQVDPYLFLRESYIQSRLIQINDGVLQPGAEEDPFEEELFAE